MIITRSLRNSSASSDTSVTMQSLVLEMLLVSVSKTIDHSLRQPDMTISVSCIVACVLIVMMAHPESARNSPAGHLTTTTGGLLVIWVIPVESRHSLLPPIKSHRLV